VKLDIATTKESDVAVFHVNVRNEAGCLSRVTSALSRAGVTIGSLACACAASDVSGTVAVGLLPRK
jgi:acetolactate synthase small subunit